jgi:SAM-dependent methyltransferase
MGLVARVLGHPVVYNHVRPALLGGLDLSPLYARAEAENDDVILDIGCGTGDALRYVPRFAQYLGVDTDPIAVRAAAERHRARANARFEARECTREDVLALSPTVVIMAGLLHHVPDELAVSLFRMVTASPRLRRIVTLDIVYLPGVEHALSNLLARLDRGRHCRSPAGYRALVGSAGLTLTDETLLWNHPRRHIARYFVMTVEPRASEGRG